MLGIEPKFGCLSRTSLSDVTSVKFSFTLVEKYVIADMK